MLSHRHPFPPNPSGFRAEDLIGGPVADGFISVTSKAREEGVEIEDVLRVVNEAGWELRAVDGQLWYRPAVVTRMGQA